jgi:hypothetical protein
MHAPPQFLPYCALGARVIGHVSNERIGVKLGQRRNWPAIGPGYAHRLALTIRDGAPVGLGNKADSRFTKSAASTERSSTSAFGSDASSGIVLPI